ARADPRLQPFALLGAQTSPHISCPKSPCPPRITPIAASPRPRFRKTPQIQRRWRLHLKATRSLPPISGRFMRSRLRTPADRRAQLCVSRLLPAFQFDSCCESEFVASTVRPARLFPQLIGQFAYHFFHGAHALFPPGLSFGAGSQRRSSQ